MRVGCISSRVARLRSGRLAQLRARAQSTVGCWQSSGFTPPCRPELPQSRQDLPQGHRPRARPALGLLQPRGCSRQLGTLRGGGAALPPGRGAIPGGLGELGRLHSARFRRPTASSAERSSPPKTWLTSSLSTAALMWDTLILVLLLSRALLPESSSSSAAKCSRAADRYTGVSRAAARCCP